ncbi:hypothetical protein AMQ83_06440, partial [Paenibacillus riograndensis]
MRPARIREVNFPVGLGEPPQSMLRAILFHLPEACRFLIIGTCMQHLDRRAVFGTAEDGFLQQWMRLRVLQLLHNTAGKIRGDELRLADHYGVYPPVFVEGGLAAAFIPEIPYPLQR